MAGWLRPDGRLVSMQPIGRPIPFHVRRAGRIEPVGLVYATDAAQSDRVITLATVPDSLHRPIVYPAAIVKGRASAKVRDLLAFFGSDTAAVIFRKHGFTFLGDQGVQR